MHRSLLKFEHAIKSPSTRDLYHRCLNLFLDFVKIKEADGLLQLKDEFLQEQLEDYLFYLKKRLNPNSIPTYFSPLELFFTMNDKVLNFKKLHKMFPEKIKTTGKGYWSTKDIQTMLKNTKVKRSRAMIHFLASTGCRVGTLRELKMKHLQDYDLGCKKVLFYEGSTKEYVCFLTPEANQELEAYFEERRKAGEKFYPDSPVFRTRFFMGMAKAKPLGEHSIKILLYNVIKRHTTRQKSGNRYNIQADHGFRKRFSTLLKSNDKSNISLVEKLLGHTGAVLLDGAYFNPSHETLFSEFKKHIHDLTIDDSERLKIKNQKLEDDKNKLTIQREEFEARDKAFEELKARFEEEHEFVMAITQAYQDIKDFIKNPTARKTTTLEDENCIRQDNDLALLESVDRYYEKQLLSGLFSSKSTKLHQ